MAIKRLTRPGRAGLVRPNAIFGELTNAELLALNATTHGPSLRWYIKLLTLERPVNLNAPQATNGFAAWVNAGILPPGRPAAIVAALQGT